MSMNASLCGDATQTPIARCSIHDILRRKKILILDENIEIWL